MPSLRVRFLVSLALASLILCAGCNSSDATPDDNKPAVLTPEQYGTTGIKTVDTKKFSQLDTAYPALDEGRVRNLAPPKNWHPTGTKLSEGFVMTPPSDKKEKPSGTSLRFIGETATEAFTEDVTLANVEKFRDAVVTELKSSTTQLLEPARAMKIGNNAYVRYVTTATQGEKAIEEQVLTTVFDGQRYTLILTVPSDSTGAGLTKYRDAAYSVAAGIAYIKP